MTRAIKIVKAADIKPAALADSTLTSRRVINQKRDGSERMSFHHVVIKDRSEWKDVPASDERDEIIYVLDGKMQIAWDEQEVELTAGTCLYIPLGCGYRVTVPDKVTLIAVFSPPVE